MQSSTMNLTEVEEIAKRIRELKEQIKSDLLDIESMSKKSQTSIPTNEFKGGNPSLFKPASIPGNTAPQKITWLVKNIGGEFTYKDLFKYAQNIDPNTRLTEKAVNRGLWKLNRDKAIQGLSFAFESKGKLSSRYRYDAPK